MIIKFEVEVKNDEEKYRLLNAMKISATKYKFSVKAMEKDGKRILVENNDIPVSSLTQKEKEAVRKKRALNMIENLKLRDLIEVQKIAIDYKIDPRKVETMEQSDLIAAISKKVL